MIFNFAFIASVIFMNALKTYEIRTSLTFDVVKNAYLMFIYKVPLMVAFMIVVVIVVQVFARGS